jgi:hypothetical protein
LLLQAGPAVHPWAPTGSCDLGHGANGIFTCHMQAVIYENARSG